MAAACLTLAINVSSSAVAPELGLRRLGDLELDSLVADNVIRIEMDGVA